MALYTVHDRPDAPPAVVADRFSWSAALFGPVYALLHGLWLMLLVWVVGIVIVAGATFYLGDDAGTGLYIVLALYLGFEAPAFRRGKLGRRGYAYRSEIVARDEDLALSQVLSAKS
jgi:hypothetical protein